MKVSIPLPILLLPCSDVSPVAGSEPGRQVDRSRREDAGDPEAGRPRSRMIFDRAVLRSRGKMLGETSRSGNINR